jgi:hypothetical protein
MLSGIAALSGVTVGGEALVGLELAQPIRGGAGS